MVINTGAVKLHKMKETPLMKEEIFIKTNRIGFIPQLGIQGPIVNPYPVTRATAKDMIVAGIEVVEVHKDGSVTELNLQNVFPGEGDVVREAPKAPELPKTPEAPNEEEKKEESKAEEPKVPPVQPITFSGVERKEDPAKEEEKVDDHIDGTTDDNAQQGGKKKKKNKGNNNANEDKEDAPEAPAAAEEPKSE